MNPKSVTKAMLQQTFQLNKKVKIEIKTTVVRTYGNYKQHVILALFNLQSCYAN